MYRLNREDDCNPVTSHPQAVALIRRKERLLLFNLNTVGKVVELDHLNNRSVKAKIWYDQIAEHLIYKLVIPFKVLVDEPAAESNIPAKIFVGLETGTPCRPANLEALAWRKGIPGRPSGSNPLIPSDRSTHSSSNLLFWTEIDLYIKKQN